jgi:DNA-binding CsgD family transcriptional regulator
MDIWPAGLPLTAREREVARLVGGGLTNRQIASKLSISERTVGAHVQNTLNKLGAANRAQIAAWSASTEAGVATLRPEARRGAVSAPALVRTRPASTPRVPNTVALVPACLVIVLLAASADGPQPVRPTGSVPATRGDLIYQAKLEGDGEGFTVRAAIGDPDASAIRFLNGSVEYAVLRPGGNTGNKLAIPPQGRYYAEVQISVAPDSNVEFWFTLTGHSDAHIQHLIRIDSRAEAMQFAYFDEPELDAIGPQVPLYGLLTGRRVTISALVDPPRYQIYLDGKSVIDVRHEVATYFGGPGFGIFGDGTGTVKLSSVKVYSLH